jgi:hypothetical protein
MVRHIGNNLKSRVREREKERESGYYNHIKHCGYSPTNFTEKKIETERTKLAAIMVVR